MNERSSNIWWNTASNTGRGSQLSFPSQEEAYRVFKLFFPTVLVQINGNTFLNTDDYWKKICDIFIKHYNGSKFPNPLVSFSDFVSFLFNLKDIINPNTLNQTISMFKYHKNLDLSHHLAYDAPLYIKDPYFYIDSLYELSLKQSELWKIIIQDSNKSCAIFNMYNTFITHEIKRANQKSMKSRLKLCYVLCKFITSVNKNTLTYSDNFNMFHSQVCVMIKYVKDDSIAVSLTRIFFTTMFKPGKKISHELMKEYFDTFFRNIPKNSQAFSVAFMYSVTKFKKSYITAGTLTRAMRRRALLQENDFFMLYQLSKKVKPQLILMTLAKFVTINKVYMRIGFHYFTLMLCDLKAKKVSSHTKEWIEQYIRKLIELIILTQIKKKYYGRGMIICEFLNSLLEADIQSSFKSHIKSQIYTASLNENCPPYLSLLVATEERSVDKMFKNELEKYKRKVSLKGLKYFPFIKKNNKFVTPKMFKNKQTKKYSSGKKTKTVNYSKEEIKNEPSNSDSDNESVVSYETEVSSVIEDDALKSEGKITTTSDDALNENGMDLESSDSTPMAFIHPQDSEAEVFDDNCSFMMIGDGTSVVGIEERMTEEDDFEFVSLTSQNEENESRKIEEEEKKSKKSAEKEAPKKRKRKKKKKKSNGEPEVAPKKEKVQEAPKETVVLPDMKELTLAKPILFSML